MSSTRTEVSFGPKGRTTFLIFPFAVRIQTVKAWPVNPWATIWCHFAFSASSLDVHVSSAQCLETPLFKNEGKFCSSTYLAGEVLLLGYVQTDVWSTSQERLRSDGRRASLVFDV